MSRTIITTAGLPGGGRWVLVRDGHGIGGFLTPPGHASQDYSVEEWRGSRSAEAETTMSVEYAIREEYVPAKIRAACARVLKTNTGNITEEWTRSVYAYFRHCYSPDGIDRNVSHCLIVKDDEQLPPAEHHLAYLHVREYDATHEPRLDLIADPGKWGN